MYEIERMNGGKELFSRYRKTESRYSLTVSPKEISEEANASLQVCRTKRLNGYRSPPIELGALLE